MHQIWTYDFWCVAPWNRPQWRNLVDLEGRGDWAIPCAKLAMRRHIPPSLRSGSLCNHHGSKKTYSRWGTSEGQRWQMRRDRKPLDRWNAFRTHGQSPLQPTTAAKNIVSTPSTSGQVPYVVCRWAVHLIKSYKQIRGLKFPTTLIWSEPRKAPLLRRDCRDHPPGTGVTRQLLHHLCNTMLMAPSWTTFVW